ncbi:unnamed protein product [Boreogadus saida]
MWDLWVVCGGLWKKDRNGWCRFVFPATTLWRSGQRELATGHTRLGEHLIASLCDLLERILDHGLRTNGRPCTH